MNALGADGFDFWVGAWDCAFDGGHAVNTITRDFAGKVVTERFVADTPTPWSGMSVSVYDERTQRWQQTWIDESGNYWAFVGGLVDGDPSFGTPEPVDADERFKRMVFSDITDDAFTWRWEASSDQRDWALLWRIDYRRR